jgi:hypothetical protein
MTSRSYNRILIGLGSEDPKRCSAKRVRTTGVGCIWPRGLRERYGVSAPTLWRWERAGKLPRRDIFIGGRAVGWRPETIERAECGES